MQASMKRFFGKRRATRTSPGGLTGQPLCRLGALVFQLNNSDKLYWASPWAPTRIAGCALSLRADCHPLERRSLRKTHGSLAEQHTKNNGGCAATITISFSLGTVFAEPSQRTPGSGLSHRRERMHPQSTDELSAQVALLQSPILSAVKTSYHFPSAATRRTQSK
jgi:hypothetical protein